MKKAQLIIGATLVALVVLTAILAVFWTPFDPVRVVPADRLLGPGWPHLLGTDGFGIDIVSRLMVGADSADRRHRLRRTASILGVLRHAGKRAAGDESSCAQQT